MDFEEVELKESRIGQFADGLGVYVKRSFKKGEVVLQWNLSTLKEREYIALAPYERENFCHKRGGKIYLYPDPERHVNRYKDPNVVPDFDAQANIALRDIATGEELSISCETIEDFF